MQINTRFLNAKRHSGFTLIELVIGIVVLALSFSIISTMILPTARQSAEQIHQIRAAELGQAILNEILAKAFDENSDMAGGEVRCGELSTACTSEDELGAEEGSGNRDQFDDVDDYNGLNVIENPLGIGMTELYKGFSILVTVCNDGDYDGVCFADDGNSDNKTAKLITITVTTAQDYEITFASYKANF
ncbi:MAG: type II secretion system protein [Alteromonadaceae bacterium]|nr:type II secretion system protein [Alteromonadaceae bacterium]